MPDSTARPQTTSVTPGAAAHNESGLDAWSRGDLDAAEQHLRAAMACDPAYASAYGNLGMVLLDRRQKQEAIDVLRRGVAADPRHADVRNNLGLALLTLGQIDEGLAQLRQVLQGQPDHPRASANAIKPLLDRCDWDASEALIERVVHRWKLGDRAAVDCIAPWVSAVVDVPRALRLEVAKREATNVAARVVGLAAPPSRLRGPRPKRGRLRVGYLSNDFRDHATMHLMAGMFEHHDRDRFEIHAYSLGRDDGSACRRRVVAAIEHFHEAMGKPHEEIAAAIARDGIDILIDLKGYCGYGRPEVLALRPAPIQIAYLGYPGTMGAPFVDALLADDIVVPTSHEADYSERIVRLPRCYQANDDRQVIATEPARRLDHGLPDEGFVFACFNQPYKIERRAFEAWMRILGAVPGSVLWLLEGHGTSNLREAARARGIDPSRLVFAPSVPKAAHLARHACADLFLDTFSCNAHTTASDALWAGLPLLTLTGDAFASRVATSLLATLGMPELAVDTVSAYEAAAVRYARDPTAHAALRHKLETQRTRSPLFDTAGFTRGFEAALLDIAASHKTLRSLA